jgi:hypothetical protein
MFLLKRIALAAAMSCLSEGAIAQEAAAPKPGEPSGPETAQQDRPGALQVAETASSAGTPAP